MQKTFEGKIMNWKFIIIFAIAILVYQLSHEITHATIYKLYECEDIKIEFFRSSAYCEDNDVRLPTAIHEILGYTVVPVLIFIALMVMPD